MKKIFKGNGETFSAKREAEKWLTDNGYSYGSSCVGFPQGILKGENICIAKMRNLSTVERKILDGRLSAGREGDAILILKDK